MRFPVYFPFFPSCDIKQKTDRRLGTSWRACSPPFGSLRSTLAVRAIDLGSRGVNDKWSSLLRTPRRGLPAVLSRFSPFHSMQKGEEDRDRSGQGPGTPFSFRGRSRRVPVCLGLFALLARSVRGEESTRWFAREGLPNGRPYRLCNSLRCLLESRLRPVSCFFFNRKTTG